jgi:hypothetical protein
MQSLGLNRLMSESLPYRCSTDLLPDRWNRLAVPRILKLRRAVLKVRRNRFHLMWFANQGEDDLAFSGEVFGSAGIGDAVDELLGTAERMATQHSGQVPGRPC